MSETTRQSLLEEPCCKCMNDMTKQPFLAWLSALSLMFQGGDLIHLLNNEVPDIILQEDQEKQEQLLEKGRMPAREAGEYEFDVSHWYLYINTTP